MAILNVPVPPCLFGVFTYAELEDVFDSTRFA
jgi:hypothetical protein